MTAWSPCVNGSVSSWLYNNDVIPQAAFWASLRHSRLYLRMNVLCERPQSLRSVSAQYSTCDSASISAPFQVRAVEFVSSVSVRLSGPEDGQSLMSYNFHPAVNTSGPPGYGNTNFCPNSSVFSWRNLIFNFPPMFLRSLALTNM